jgi:hypothetical protein
MNCSICRHPRQAEMIVDYAFTCSLRVTASRYEVGYRSLHRHIERCIYAIMKEDEQKDYEKRFREVAEFLRFYFKPIPKPYRRKSIIKKKVEFTWSRRAWSRKYQIWQK